MAYEPTIGLEIHVELKTKTKMFCDSPNDPDEKHPNVNVCPICMGHPGTLPVINKEAVKKVITVGKALDCQIEDETFFERKNYFYPDLPKGYQISQYQKPFCRNGFLELSSGRKIRIERIHLEEDAGKLLHDREKGWSSVDFNRAGVPLMELVTEPDFQNGAEVKEFAGELQLILRHLDVSDANMEKGQMRIEVNISLKEPESGEFGIKVEIKNLNSIKAATQSVDYEIKRQGEILEEGNKVKQETRGWDDNKQITFSQRSKEEAHDYRYFPEPDLSPVRLSEDPELDPHHISLPELPSRKRERFERQYGLPKSDIGLLISNKPLGDYFENVISELKSWDKLSHLEKPSEEHQARLIKLAANYLITELQKLFYESNFDLSDIKHLKITPENFAEFTVKVHTGEVSSTGAQALLKEMFETGADPDDIIKAKDLTQVSDIAGLSVAIGNVIIENKEAVEDFKKGKEQSLMFLVGKVMAVTKGKANPQVVAKLLKEKLK